MGCRGDIANVTSNYEVSKFLETWYSSNNSINKHNELDHVYIRIRGRQLIQLRGPQLKSYKSLITDLSHL